MQPAATAAVLTKVVDYATALEHGTAETGWTGGYVQYVWGGGHKASPGPSTGTCVGDPDSLSCTDPAAIGTDCSGFARWVYALAYGSDVLGSGATGSELARTHKMSTAQAGDLVFFGTDTTHTHHVGVYIGGGKMINSYKTGQRPDQRRVRRQRPAGLLPVQLSGPPGERDRPFLDRFRSPTSVKRHDLRRLPRDRCRRHLGTVHRPSRRGHLSRRPQPR